MTASSHEESTGLGAARIALASVWCAAATTFDVFAPPRFSFDVDTASEPLDGQAAALRLTRLRGHRHAIGLTPGGWNGTALAVRVARIERDDHPTAGLAGCPPEAATRILIVAGGRGLRVSRAMLHEMAASYRIAASASAAGSSPTDPWAVGLRLPEAWLVRVNFVLMLGTPPPTGAMQPLSVRPAFALASSEDLIDRDRRSDER